MAKTAIRDLVHRYYEAWAARDRDAAARQLADELTFVSPEDRYESAAAFLSACWRYSEGLAGVGFLHEIYDEGQAFVILQWRMEDGSTFQGAEYLRCADGAIRDILVVSNTLSFPLL